MTLLANSTGRFQRSPESHAFESFWRSLRGTGLVPRRADFHPSRALRFLRDIVLIEGPDDQGTLRIRVAGERFKEIIGCNITGQSPIDMLPEEFREGAAVTSRLMVYQPCGLWQITPAHLARGYALNLEVTGFPLAPDERGLPFLLLFVRPRDGIMPVALPTLGGMAVDTATQFQFIDIGAGEPVWAPPEAA